MSDEDLRKQTIAHLRATLEAGDLPTKVFERGTAIYQRLIHPVRLTFMGLPGAGKSSAINVFLGESSLPIGTKLPTAEIVWGAEPAARAIRADGSKDRISWPPEAGFNWSDVVYLKIALPNPALKKISLLEVVSDGTAQDLSSSMNWAIPRTDLAIWCTQSFEKIESALWVQVPDAMKDHAFLAITKADEVSLAGALPDTIKRLGPIAAEEFQKLLAVASKPYLAALEAGNTDPSVRSSTGAAGFIDTIMSHVDSGRRADMDGAEIFLAKHGIAEIPSIEDLQGVAENSQEQTAEVLADEQPSVETGTLNSAYEILRQKGEDLINSGETSSEVVLESCSEAIDSVLDLLSASNAPSTDLTEEIEESQDLIILMQLEQDESSAADAATVLLQLSRELKTAIAA